MISVISKVLINGNQTVMISTISHSKLSILNSQLSTVNCQLFFIFAPCLISLKKLEYDLHPALQEDYILGE